MTCSEIQTPKQAEVWLAYLNFKDKPKAGKVRPVLILDEHSDSTVRRVICLKITTQHPEDGRVDFKIKGWEQCGLKKPSYARLDQVFEIKTEKLLRNSPLGVMNNAEFEQILSYFEEHPK